MPPAGDRSHRETIGRASMVLGGSIAIISVASDALGIGERADVGPRQALAAIVGVVIILCGGALASSRRPTAFRLLYALFVVVFSALLFGGAEILLRREADAWPFDLDPLPMPYLTERDAHLGWRLPPGNGNNMLGLRNREIGPKPPNTCRILFLGDSLLYYGELSSKRTYLEEVEARLGSRYEVINAGVPGYTTYQEVELLREYGYGFDPDVVFLGFVLNDLFYPYLHRPALETKLAVDPKTRLTRFDTRAFPGTIFAGSYAAHELVLGFEELRARTGTSFTFERHADVFLAWRDYGWRDSERLLAELSRDLEARGIPFYVLTFPLRQQTDHAVVDIDEERVLEPQRRLRGFLAGLGRPMLDAQPILLERGGPGLFSDHLHLNAQGNAVLADFLSGAIREEIAKWPAPCGP